MIVIAEAMIAGVTGTTGEVTETVITRSSLADSRPFTRKKRLSKHGDAPKALATIQETTGAIEGAPAMIEVVDN